MNFTYISGSNTATNGQALGVVGQDVYIKQLIIGTPVASANIIIYNKGVAFSGDTSNIAAKITLPGTLTQGTATYNYSTVINLAGANNKGLQVDGGNVMIDQTLQLTVVWQPVTEESDN